MEKQRRQKWPCGLVLRCRAHARAGEKREPPPRRPLVELEAARLDGGPPHTLVVPGEAEENGQSDHPLDAHQLAFVRLGLRRPGEEGAHVLGHLRRRSGGAVIVVDRAIVEGRRHANPRAREVWVVVLGLASRNAGRGILVPDQQREDVVGAVVACLHDERQVGWVGAIVGIAGSLLVGIRRGQVVRQLA
eukprot:scaffold180_cov134-Isochrysis_galbana.AAC.7